jgi:membrane-bound ClpP family serine protease
MKSKGEMSARKAWLIVLVSLLDDAVVLVFVFLGLLLFHVEITWWIILIIAVIMAAFVLLMHKAIVPAIRRRKIDGEEGMIGLTGKVTESLKPVGVVKIKGEYWTARSSGAVINVGDDVEVTAINGLVLEVKKKDI